MSSPSDTQPSFTALLDWLEGRLDAVQAAEVEAAAGRGNAETAARVQWLRSFLAGRSDRMLEAPPLDVRLRLRRAFDEWAGMDASRFMPARQCYDSRTAPQLAGVRSAAADVVTLEFDTTDGDTADSGAQVKVTLDLRPVGDGALTLSGTVSAPETAGTYRVLLFAEGSTVPEVAATDEHGQFVFAHIAATQYLMRLDDGTTAVELPLDAGGLG
jgi:hypothetical protein